MKQLYTILMAMLLSLVGISANAFTLNIEIDDASRISEVTTYPAQAGVVDFSSGKCAVTFADNNSMRYVTIKAMEGKYIMSYEIKDEDGESLVSKSCGKSVLSYLSIPATADYGTLYITTSDELKADCKLTVNLTGDPKKVSFSFNAKRFVDLKEGTNEIEYVSASEGGTVYVMPVDVAMLYKVQMDGVEVAPRASSAEGAVSYQYNLQPHDGAVIDIVTDFPNVDYTCTFALPEGMDDIIKSVKVDGVAVADINNVKAHAGSKIDIATSRDYKVASFTVNGKEMVYTDELSGQIYWSGSWNAIVTGDLVVKVEGTPFNRPFKVTTKTYGWNKVMNGGDKGSFTGTPDGAYEFLNAQLDYIELPVGEGSFKFGVEDNPFLLYMYSYNENPDFTITVCVNGEVLDKGYASAYSIDFKDGDVLSIYFGVDVEVGIDPQPAATTGEVYSLHGVKMERGAHLPAGIYVKNGKKVIVKK